MRINQLPHPKLSDRFMTRLSWVMTGGNGWLLFMRSKSCDGKFFNLEIRSPMIYRILCEGRENNPFFLDIWEKANEPNVCRRRLMGAYAAGAIGW